MACKGQGAGQLNRRSLRVQGGDVFGLNRMSGY